MPNVDNLKILPQQVDSDSFHISTREVFPTSEMFLLSFHQMAPLSHAQEWPYRMSSIARYFHNSYFYHHSVSSESCVYGFI